MKLISTILALGATLNAASYNYYTVGLTLPMPIPSISIGHREKSDNGTYDVSANLSTIFIASQISVTGKYLKYSKKGSNYAGIGETFWVSMTNKSTRYGLMPFFTIGAEDTKYFHEIDFSMVSFSDIGVKTYPVGIYRSGVKF